MKTEGSLKPYLCEAHNMSTTALRKHQTKINFLILIQNSAERRSKRSDNVNRTDRYLILISTHMKMMIIDEPHHIQQNQIENERMLILRLERAKIIK